MCELKKVLLEYDPSTEVVFQDENGNWLIEYEVEPINVQDDGVRQYRLSEKQVEAMRNAWIIN